tara:strand:+ start:130 stop:336 length:207 start_codon:yes stop_codon:yes gene_type:complete
MLIEILCKFCDKLDNNKMLKSNEQNNENETQSNELSDENDTQANNKHETLPIYYTKRRGHRIWFPILL